MYFQSRPDLWPEYLALWQKLWRLELTVTYSARAKDCQREEFLDFILWEDGDFLDVHFLWIGNHRKLLIERKLIKSWSGRPVGHLLHRNHDPATVDESRHRVGGWRHGPIM